MNGSENSKVFEGVFVERGGAEQVPLHDLGKI